MVKSSTAKSLDVHVKDCAMFRKDLKKQATTDRRLQTARHAENSKRQDKADDHRNEISKKIDTVGVNVTDLSNSVTALKNKEAKDKERRQFWWNRARDAIIATLVTALGWSLWHIIATKGLGP